MTHYNNLLNKINCIRDWIADTAKLEEPYHIAYDVIFTLVITFVFFLISPGKILPFVYSWIIWEIFILSLSRNYYDPIRRFFVVMSSIILYIGLELIRSAYRGKAFF